MMKQRFIIPLIVALILLAIAGGVGLAQEGTAVDDSRSPAGIEAALGTAFTYQGQLRDGSTPANDIYDFRFRLYDDATAGSQVGSIVLVDDVAVSDGLFTVELDFGTGVFGGDALYLQIGVRPGASTSNYTALLPRQSLTAVPYATYAQGAPWAGLSNVPSGFADGVDDNTTYSAGSGLDLQHYAFSLTPPYRLPQGCHTGEVAKYDMTSGLWLCAEDDSGAGGSYWSLNGNLGTNPATHYVGTGDAVTLTLAVNATPALRLVPTTGTPNIIGGSPSNAVASGLSGVTIGGGGSVGLSHSAGGSYTVIAGGLANSAGGNYATVSGGYNNSAAAYAAIGGGLDNVASNTYATIGGGDGNVASALYTAVGGGSGNAAGTNYASISGGSSNSANGGASHVGGGLSNQTSGDYAAISGGRNNNASAGYATISGGHDNSATTLYAAIGGGYNNSAGGTSAHVGGGTANSASANYTSIGGGQDNSAGNPYATIGGGYSNSAAAGYATIGGGESNTASGTHAVIAGGENNATGSNHAAVGGGLGNTATGTASAVGGGAGNVTSDTYAAISGGYGNAATASYTAVGGGLSNTAGADYATVGGGYYNNASGASAHIGGGRNHAASGDSAVISGGENNQVTAGYGTIGGGGNSDPALGNLVTDEYGTVGGGSDNQAGDGDAVTDSARYTTVGGGTENTASDTAATVGGGFHNTASDDAATVAGGEFNSATGSRSTVGGGTGNVAIGNYATVAGGGQNSADGMYATAAGGYNNEADGDYSFAAGNGARAIHNGSFVWSDSSGGTFASTGNNRFMARATGGVYFYTNMSLNTGSYLAAGGSAWNAVSDRNRKENLQAVDGRALLAAIDAIDITTWNYIEQDDAIRHVGPMAQDFNALLPGLGGEGAQYINSLDADGVALAAIQALHNENQKLAAANQELQQRVDALEGRHGLGKTAVWVFLAAALLLTGGGGMILIRMQLLARSIQRNQS